MYDCANASTSVWDSIPRQVGCQLTDSMVAITTPVPYAVQEPMKCNRLLAFRLWIVTDDQSPLLRTMVRRGGAILLA